MHILNLLWRTIIQLAKQAWLLPESVATHFRERRRREVLSQLEAERLDRIRHPSKYLGK